MTPVENALARLVTRKLENCPLLAICQLFDVGKRRFHLDRMKLQCLGLYPKVYNNRVMLHVIDGSTLANLRPLFCASNCVLLGDDATLLTSLTEALEKIPHLMLLACVVDGRILTPKQVETFRKAKRPEDFALQTVGLLRQGPSVMTSMLQQPVLQLLSCLYSRIQLLNGSKQCVAT
ncbi:unnamed protein product [Soboliphyme baturini]|uniref:Large ribosomal subunit protein uL10m n=1 Tax=Soboliphyme baturini TaxID=241478 RepID=A0A3P8DHG1_9BILA|nr:unnamed protein product [Soboliphyme baturini]